LRFFLKGLYGACGLGERKKKSYVICAEREKKKTFSFPSAIGEKKGGRTLFACIFDVRRGGKEKEGDLQPLLDNYNSYRKRSQQQQRRKKRGTRLM